MQKLRLFFSSLFLCGIVSAQNSYTIYDQVIFYDGYAATVNEPVPDGVTRINNATYTTKLSSQMVSNLALGKLSMDVTIGALCDNYDRLGHVYLAFVPKGLTSYTQSEVERIEIARIITPFMNKNISPTSVPYHFQIDNVSEIFRDSNLMNSYDVWVELEVFGVPYAANTQVQGCAGRNDVFTGTMVMNASTGSENYTDSPFLLPLSCRVDLNNYNATDVPGETTRILTFSLNEPVEDAVLYLITSNHGANSGGEEYNRRWHYVYLDDELIYSYIPGGKSCEPWRQYNTQGNGIYGTSPKTTRTWLTFNNWCPGDKIPNREVALGDLSAGSHVIKLDVPDAVFVNNEGYFPISMYIQNRKSGQMICVDPTDFEIVNQVGNTLSLDWTENGDATQWEIMYGRKSLYTQEYFVDDTDGEPGFDLTGLTNNFYYQVYVRSKCDENFTSNWVGPIDSERILGLQENSEAKFTVYPNPTVDYVQVDSFQPIESIQIFNAEGKLVSQSKSTRIPMKAYPAGIYSFQIQFKNGEIQTTKVVKK